MKGVRVVECLSQLLGALLLLVFPELYVHLVLLKEDVLQVQTCRQQQQFILLRAPLGEDQAHVGFFLAVLAVHSLFLHRT